MENKVKNIIKIMKKLRGKKGCLWDKEQTIASLKPYILEEAFEVVEAIEEENYEKIKEELGDLLLQIVFVSQIASELGIFNINDVSDTICQKMVRRHPHIFGSIKVSSSRDVTVNWNKIKAEEEKPHISILEGIPKTLPALLKAHKVSYKASAVGFDWNNHNEVMAKIKEELDELGEALKNNEKTKIEEETGDLLFAIVNLARFNGINSEIALRKTIAKFKKRFKHIEKELAKTNRKTWEATLEEMENLWNEAKTLDK